MTRSTSSTSRFDRLEPHWRPPRLDTERLILRALTLDDIPAIFAYASNRNVTRFTQFDTHRTLQDSRDFFTYAKTRYLEQVPEPMGILLRDRPEIGIVGTVGTYWVKEEHCSMEIGYALAEEHWGNGYIVEAAQILLIYTFASYAVERVQARVLVGNEASERVLHKLGFTFEGTQRHGLLHRGIFRDVRIYSLLREEWPGPGGGRSLQRTIP